VNEIPAANETKSAPQEAVSAASGAAQLVRAWSILLQSELAVARDSIRWLLVGAVVTPVVALGAWLGLNALLVAAAQLYTGSLVLALLLTCGVQLLALGLLLNQLRRWARELTLPHSRAALARAAASCLES
jgi:hypothetical protein